MTEGSYSGSYASSQYVQTNNQDVAQGTFFVLPAYTVNCEGQTLTRTAEVVEELAISDPVETTAGSGIYKVVPLDISIK